MQCESQAVCSVLPRSSTILLLASPLESTVTAPTLCRLSSYFCSCEVLNPLKHSSVCRKLICGKPYPRRIYFACLAGFGVKYCFHYRALPQKLLIVNTLCTLSNEPNGKHSEFWNNSEHGGEGQPLGVFGLRWVGDWAQAVRLQDKCSSLWSTSRLLQRATWGRTVELCWVIPMDGNRANRWHRCVHLLVLLGLWFLWSFFKWQIHCF